MTLDLSPLLEPRSVAVFGASSDPNRPGGRCLAGLIQLGFAGPIYPVNPDHATINGQPCYPSLAGLPQPPDLAVILLPALAVPATLVQCVHRGVRAAIVCASGLDDTNPEGAQAAEECYRIAARSGLVLLGPNSLGVLSIRSGLAATFSTILDDAAGLEPGPVTLVSQSGAMGAAILAEAQATGLPIGTFISTGNELCLGVEDVIEHLASDDSVEVILLYLESIRRGRLLLQALGTAVSRGKRIGVLQAGRTVAGQHAALLHTSALAPPGRTTAAILAAVGCAVVTSPAALIGAGQALAFGDEPAGPRLGLVTTSGGAGVLMADRGDDLGLSLAQLSSATQRRLACVLPAFTPVANPVDCGGIAGDAPGIEQAVAAVADDESVDVLIFFAGLSPSLVDHLVPALARIRNDSGKPVLVCWQGAPPGALGQLRALRLAAYSDPVDAVDGAWALTRSLPSAQWRAAEPAPLQPTLATSAVPSLASLPPLRALDEWDSRELLAGRGVPLVECRRVASPEEALAAAESLGGDVAVKATGLVHRSDANGVALNVRPHQAAAAYLSVTAANGGDALVEPMAPRGFELLVGTSFDQSWGPLLIVGRGGIDTEEVGDSAVAIAPLDRGAARELILSLRSADRLTGRRSGQALDIESVIDVVVELSVLAAEMGPDLVALDINPLIVYPRGAGCLAVDAAAAVRDRTQPKERPCPDE